MSIYYANPGYYQFMRTITTNKFNTSDPKYTVTGAGIEMDKETYYLVTEDLNKQDLYFKFDIYQRTDYLELGVNTYENANGIMRIGTNNDDFPYLEMVLRNSTLYVQRVGKDGDLVTIITVPHMEQYNNEIVTYEVHLDTDNETDCDIIELWINNVLQATVNDVSYFDKAIIDSMEISHGMPSAITEAMRGYDECSYFSNIIIADTRLANKKCVVLPTKVISTDWVEKDNTYISTDVGQTLVQKVDMEELSKTIYDNTVIDAIMCGSDVAYSEGFNNVVRYSVDGTEFDAKTLANKSYHGIKTKVLEVNPATDEAWTQDSLRDAEFTLTSDSRE